MTPVPGAEQFLPTFWGLAATAATADNLLKRDSVKVTNKKDKSKLLGKIPKFDDMVSFTRGGRAA